MGLSLNSLTSSRDNVDRTSYTTASVTPSSYALVIVCFDSRFGTGNPAQPTVSSSHSFRTGWTSVSAYDYDNSGATTGALAVWAAITNGNPGANTITVDFGAQTQLAGSWSVFEILGARIDNGIGPGANQAIVQQVQGATNAPSSAAPTLTLSSAAFAENRGFSTWAHEANEVTNPRTNWTEIHDHNGTSPNGGFESQWRSDTFETTAGATWATSIQWGGIAFEVNADVRQPIGLLTAQQALHRAHSW